MPGGMEIKGFWCSMTWCENGSVGVERSNDGAAAEDDGDGDGDGDDVRYCT